MRGISKEGFLMGAFADKIRSTYVEKGNLALFWAGQAGFIIKTDEQKLIGLDLYLSDCCERYFGFKRIIPYILEPHELDFDYIVSSHAHYDHFDVDAVPMLMRGDTQFIGAMDTKAECDKAGMSDKVTFIKCGDEVSLGRNTVLKGVPCDHGVNTPDALGLLIKSGKKTVYYMGDTCYREDYYQNDEVKGADVLLAPINGKFGNMNSQEAANAANILEPHVTVPYHFWTFVEHGGNPEEFKNQMIEMNLSYKLLRIGEGIII